MSPTIGVTTAGTSSEYMYKDTKTELHGPDCYLPVMGRFISMTCRCRTSAGTYSIRMAIYKVINGIPIAPLEAQTGTVAIDTTMAWRTTYFSPQPILNVGAKALAVKFQEWSYIAWDWGTTNTELHNATDVWDGFEDPFGEGGTQRTNAFVSIYATYEEVVLGGDEGLGARAVLPILARRREPLSFPPRLGWLARFPKLKPLRI